MAAPLRSLDTPPVPAEIMAGPDMPDPVDLEGFLAPVDDPAHKPWQITGRSTAEWAMTRLVEARAALAPIVERHQLWRDRLRELEQSETAALSATAAFFNGHLERYALGLRVDGELTEKAARLKLANGHVQTAAYGPLVTVVDNDAVVGWAEAPGREGLAAKIVETTKKVPVSRLKLVVALVEWPTRVLLAPCAHEVDVPTAGLVDAETGELVHPLHLVTGKGVACPACGEGALVARFLGHRLAVIDANGAEVPGAGVKPGHVTATVHPD